MLSQNVRTLRRLSVNATVVGSISRRNKLGIVNLCTSSGIKTMCDLEFRYSNIAFAKFRNWESGNGGSRSTSTRAVFCQNNVFQEKIIYNNYLKCFYYIYIFISSVWRPGKRGVEFPRSIRNASRSRRKVGNRVSYTRFPLPTLPCAGYSEKLILNIQRQVKKNTTSDP